MSDLAFYHYGCEKSRGPRAALVFSRRVLRRVLRPMFYRLQQILQAVVDRLDAQEERQLSFERRLSASLAYGWDHVAVSRRLAVLEDQVETLLREREAAGATQDSSESPIPFPLRGAELQEGSRHRSKVS